jgi:predicted AAA+ superfamily ATPase
MFIITGSHQPELHQTVSQTLAGRTSILTLLPFSIKELSGFQTKLTTFDIIYQGTFPRLHNENLVILEIIKRYHNSGKRPDIYFYRDTHGNEVDLIVRKNRRLIPLEIKSAATFTKDFFKGIERFDESVGDICEEGYVLYNGTDEFSVKGRRVINIFKDDGLDKLNIY